MGLRQLDGTPARRYYSGFDPKRAVAIADLRAMSHKRLPRFALEYLEGGAEDEVAMFRERRAFAEWRFQRLAEGTSAHEVHDGKLIRKPVAPSGNSAEMTEGFEVFAAGDAD